MEAAGRQAGGVRSSQAGAAATPLESLEFSMRFASAKFPPKTKQTKTNTHTHKDTHTAHTQLHTLLPATKALQDCQEQLQKGNAPCRRARPGRVFPGRFLVMPVSVFLSSGFFFFTAAAAAFCVPRAETQFPSRGLSLARLPAKTTNRIGQSNKPKIV